MSINYLKVDTSTYLMFSFENTNNELNLMWKQLSTYLTFSDKCIVKYKISRDGWV